MYSTSGELHLRRVHASQLIKECFISLKYFGFICNDHIKKDEVLSKLGSASVGEK